MSGQSVQRKVFSADQLRQGRVPLENRNAPYSEAERDRLRDLRSTALPQTRASVQASLDVSLAHRKQVWQLLKHFVGRARHHKLMMRQTEFPQHHIASRNSFIKQAQQQLREFALTQQSIEADRKTLATLALDETSPFYRRERRAALRSCVFYRQQKQDGGWGNVPARSLDFWQMELVRLRRGRAASVAPKGAAA